MIDPRSRPRRRQHAEWNRDDDRDDEAEQRQLGGGRQAGADLGCDRLARRERIAEIALGEIVGVAEELLDQRLVEAEFFPDLLDGFLRCGGPSEIRGGIARQRAGQQEGDDDDPDQRRNREHQALADHGQHGVALLLLCGCGRVRATCSAAPPLPRNRGLPRLRIGDWRKSGRPDLRWERVGVRGSPKRGRGSWLPLTLPPSHKERGNERAVAASLRKRVDDATISPTTPLSPSPSRDNPGGGGTSTGSR